MKQKFLTLSFFIQTLSIIILCFSSGCAQTNNGKSSSAANHLIPAPTGFVNDFADVIDEKTKAELEQTLKSFKKEAEIDFVIATVKTTGEQSIFDYSLAVANDWGVGAKNPGKSGILILIAVDDRRWFIQISRSMEAIMSNDEVGQWGALMRPFFKEKKYGEGITESVGKFIEELKERRQVRAETEIK